MFYTYLIENPEGRWYTGYTNDLKKRLQEHNRGLNFSTKPHRPWKIVYYEAPLLESDARRREGYLKTTQGGRMLKLRLKDYIFESRTKEKFKSRNSTTGYA